MTAMYVNNLFSSHLCHNSLHRGEKHYHSIRKFSKW